MSQLTSLKLPCELATSDTLRLERVRDLLCLTLFAGPKIAEGACVMLQPHSLVIAAFQLATPEERTAILQRLQSLHHPGPKPGDELHKS